jgi:hypothetical protein
MSPFLNHTPATYSNGLKKSMVRLEVAVLNSLVQRYCPRCGSNSQRIGKRLPVPTSLISFSYVRHFICKLLHHVCPDERTRTGLFSILIDLLLERYQKAIDHVRFIIKVERFSTPMTLNHYFNDNLQKFRSERLQKATKKMAISRHNEYNFTEECVRLEDVVKSVPMGNVEHTTLDIHSILKSYYKVGRKRFVDTVCMQGTDYHVFRPMIVLFVSSLHYSFHP